MPVFNGGAYLQASVNSMRRQTWHDFELIIVDDGSSDGSGEWLREQAQEDSRIHLVSRENRGLVATLNEMLALARGEFLVRMDADDVALPDRITRQVQYLDAHPEVVCVGGSSWLMDEESRLIAPIVPPTSHEAIDAGLLRGHTTINHPAATMRREAVLACGGYHTEAYPTEDLDLWLRLAERGRLANLAEPVLCYRIHSGSISGQSAQGRQREAARRTCQAAWQRRGLQGIEFEATEPWRPDDRRASRAAFLIRYGWMAFACGQSSTARHYGSRALKTTPWANEAWRLWLAAWLKRPPMRTLPPVLG